MAVLRGLYDSQFEPLCEEIILTGHIEAFGQPARGAGLTTLRPPLHSRGELKKWNQSAMHDGAREDS
jgi:hypothetical protein